MAKGIQVGVGGVTKKVKKIFIGVGGVARKVKKVYLGVAGAIKLAWSGEIVKAPVTASLQVPKSDLAGANVGEYMLFGGGRSVSYPNTNYSDIDAFNSSFVRSKAAALSYPRAYLGAARVRDYALFAGGSDGGFRVDAISANLTRISAPDLSESKAVFLAESFADCAVFNIESSTIIEAYGSSLVKVAVPPTSTIRLNAASAKTKRHIIFAGGVYGKSADAYNTSFVKVAIADLSMEKSHLAGAGTNAHALFAGGRSGSAALNIVDIYNDSLVLITPSSITTKKSMMASLSFDDNAVFAGGVLEDNTYANNQVDVFDSSLVRTSPGNLSISRYSPAVASNDNNFMIAGGITTNYIPQSNVDIYTN